MERIGVQWSQSYTGANYRSCVKSMPTSLPDLVPFLQSLTLFEGLNNDVLALIVKESCQRTFQAGEVLFHQGDPGATCHVIIAGRVRVFVVGEDGRELAMRIIGAGETVGEMALFEKLPRSASIEALEETHTLEIDQEAFFRILQRSPTLALHLLRAMSRRLRTTTEDAEGLASLPVPDRLMRQLRRLAQYSGAPTADGYIRIIPPMTQQELAALAGTSRESINRALVSLRREGRVRLEDGWILLPKGETL